MEWGRISENKKKGWKTRKTEREWKNMRLIEIKKRLRGEERKKKWMRMQENDFKMQQNEIELGSKDVNLREWMRIWYEMNENKR